jgi:hypothetical protein
VDALRFALLLRARGDSRRAAVDRAARAVADLVLDPVGGLADRPLVVVPTGALHRLPWSALPQCVGRPVSVAPSATTWHRAATTPPSRTRRDHTGQDGARPQSARQDGARPQSGRQDGARPDRARQDGTRRDQAAPDGARQDDAWSGRVGRSVWVAGPGLRHAESEVTALHAAHGGTLLTGSAATADRVLAELADAGTAHLACHGRFRPDQPLFSQLVLADGAVFGHDLTRLRRAPELVVLSACDVGRSAVGPGDSLHGLAAALLQRGTRALIAGLLPVPDAAAVPVMSALHAGIRAGLGPAAALARAQADCGDLGLICLGAG